MNKVNLLLFRGSPRSNIHNVERWNERLPCDKLIVRYVLEHPAYKIARNFFLEHTEYTHLVIATDDIVVQPRHIEMLQKDLEEKDYPVLSGMMNVNQSDTEIVNLTTIMPSKQRSGRYYRFIKRQELEGSEDIFQVAFSGFPLMAIRRDIVEKFNFDADRIYQGLDGSRGASLDLVFCWNCQENDIPVWADKRIDMKHLRKSGTKYVGIKPSEVIYWKTEEAPITL
jgi:hypothetical protein